MKWTMTKVLIGLILGCGLIIGWTRYDRMHGATVSFSINVQQQQPQSQFFVRSDVGGKGYQDDFIAILNDCTGLQLTLERTGVIAHDRVVLSPQSPQNPPQGFSLTLFNRVRNIVTSGQGPLEIFVHEHIRGTLARMVANQMTREPVVTWVDAFRVVPMKKAIAGYNFGDFREGDPGRGTVDLADWQKFPTPQQIPQLGLPDWVTDRCQVLIHMLSEYWHSATVNPNYDVSHAHALEQENRYRQDLGRPQAASAGDLDPRADPTFEWNSAAIGALRGLIIVRHYPQGRVELYPVVWTIGNDRLGDTLVSLYVEVGNQQVQRSLFGLDPEFEGEVVDAPPILVRLFPGFVTPYHPIKFKIANVIADETRMLKKGDTIIVHFPVLPGQPGFLFDKENLVAIVDTNFFKVGKCLRVKLDFKGIGGIYTYWQSTQVQECKK